MTVLASARREEAWSCIICNYEQLGMATIWSFSLPLQSTGRKGNPLQRRLAGLYFAASAHKGQ